jgi:hypothetical protein
MDRETETASGAWSGSIQSDVDAKWTIHPHFIFQPHDLEQLEYFLCLHRLQVDLFILIPPLYPSHIIYSVPGQRDSGKPYYAAQVWQGEERRRDITGSSCWSFWLVEHFAILTNALWLKVSYWYRWGMKLFFSWQFIHVSWITFYRDFKQNQEFIIKTLGCLMNGTGDCRIPGAKDSNHSQVFLLNSHFYPNICLLSRFKRKYLSIFFSTFHEFTYSQFWLPHFKLP